MKNLSVFASILVLGVEKIASAAAYEALSSQATINSPSVPVNARTGPGLDKPVGTTLPHGASVTAIARATEVTTVAGLPGKASWYRVQTRAGDKFWVWGAFLSLSSSKASPVTKTSKPSTTQAHSTPPSTPVSSAGATAANSPAPITYAGGQPLAGIADAPGQVRFVAPRAADMNAWVSADPDPHRHFALPYCADLTQYTKGWSHGTALAGPAVPFKVLDRFVWPQTGGAVFIQLADGTVVGFGHLTEISSDAYAAAKSRTELKPGTFLGAATATIGVSTGPHVHIQAWRSADKIFQSSAALARAEWAPKLRGTKTPTANDSATQ